MGGTKCAAFWGGRASLMGASSGLVRWENRDEAPVSGGAPMPPLRLIDRCPARCATAQTSRPMQTHPGFPKEQPPWRSEEHTSELQSLMRNSYAVFCLKQNK